MSKLSDLLAAAAGAPANAAALIGGYYDPPPAGGPPMTALATTAAGTSSTTSSDAPPGMTLLDYQDVAQLSPAAGADGLCTITFGPVAAGQLWLVDRYAVSCTSAGSTDCLVYVGDTRTQNLRDASRSGNLDIADNNSPLQVAGSRELIFQWLTADAGAVATAAIQYRVFG